MADKDREEIIKQNEQKKKMLLIAVCVVAGIFIVFGLTYLVLSLIKGNLDAKKEADWQAKYNRIPSYSYAEPDYDLNIFEDEKYMAMDRSVKFYDGFTTTTIKENNLDNYSIELQFMYNVVQMIIKGDYAGYNNIFTDEYLRNAGEDRRERFPMQQLYNIELEIVDYSKAGNVAKSVISVSYMIRNNTGTFRNDLDYNEEAIRPMVYMLTTTGTDIKVTNYVPRSKYEAGIIN